jgi:3-hydroxyacyl-CoA dehydrogenase / enoyl-CoA hydratase / 3-hydroxybutyryl-CoA epimerase
MSQTNNLFSVTRRDKGIAVIRLDAEGAKVNTLSTRLGELLGPVLEELSADTSCAGVVVISGKPDNFVAGADIEELSRVKSAEEGAALSRGGHEMLARLAAMKIPVVAAIHGSCLGGGLELALACHGRVCSDAEETKLGLPEIQLGLIPGAGGTQRLPKLVGAQVALDMILTGKNIRPKKAVKMGLVDEAVAAPVLETAAVARALSIAKRGKEEASRSFVQAELDGLKRWAKDADLTEILLEGNPLGRMVMFKKAREMVQKKTRGNYPAAFAALKAVEAGLDKGMEKGLEVEAEEFGKLTVSDVSKRLVEIYFATQSLKKDKGVKDASVKPTTVERLGILGGGLMGGGIAYVAADRGVAVRIKERDHESAARALGAVGKLVGERVKRKSLTRREGEQLAARVTAGVDLQGFSRADLVVEAVFEDLALKQGLLREVESATRAECIFASNTSSLPITKIAQASRRPGHVLGMHFFSPVHKMPLLEVIVHPLTDDVATATAVAFGKKIGKQVIVVRDGVGFYTSRILAPYMNEAARVLIEGADIRAIDSAMMDFGYPVGPIVLMDEVGIDVGEKVAHIMFDAFGERMRGPEELIKVREDGRLGRKNKRGFYLYEGKKGKKKTVDETVYDLLPGGRKRKPIDPAATQKRIALQMVNEALYCLGEGILRSPRDGDIGAIFGLGFPPFLGGPFRYVDVRGAQEVLDDLKRLRDQHGIRFEPAPALVDAARNNHKFQDR